MNSGYVSASVLKPFEMCGNDMQSLSDAINWLKMRTKKKTVDAMDIRILSLDSFQKRDDNKYNVQFLSIDTLHPYIREEKNLFRFNQKQLRVGKSVLDMIEDSGMVFEINQKIYVVDPSTISSLGDILDCHGKMLNRSSLARDLCVSEALADMDEINFVYRENMEKGIKSIVSVFGKRFVFTEIDLCVEQSLSLLPKPHEMELYKWKMNNEFLYIYMEYPRCSTSICNNQWNFGVYIRITNLYGSSVNFQWYARQGDKFVTLQNKNLPHHNNEWQKKKQDIRNEFFQVFAKFRVKLETMQQVINLPKACKTYMLKGTNLLDELLKNTNIPKALGARRCTEFKEKIMNDILMEDEATLNDFFVMILEKGVPYCEELNDRYQLMYTQGVNDLMMNMKNELRSFIKEEKNNRQIEGQISLFDGKVNHG